VLKRGMEEFLMNYLFEQCRQRSLAGIRGQYIRSSKNDMVSEFYARFGFARVSVDQGQSNIGVLDLSSSATACWSNTGPCSTTELQAQAAHSAELQSQNVLQTRRSEDLYAQLEKATTWRAELDHSYCRLLGATSLISADVKGLRQSLRARGADEAVRDVELRQRYLDLLESALTGHLYGDPSISPWGAAGYDPEVRQIGRDWPSLAQTMIGTVRMRNIRTLAEQILEDGIAGDFLEAGVWRGGACIYMRGILGAHADSGRTVFVADSFAGLPKPDQDLYPADANDPHHTVKELVIPLEDVKKNFAHYGLLDNQVVFLEGWFKDTLPSAPLEKLAMLRLDGDMYSSTTETLEALYWKVSPGGFVIIDDYILPACRSAVEDFRARIRITDAIQDIDGAGVYWRKTV